MRLCFQAAFGLQNKVTVNPTSPGCNLSYAYWAASLFSPHRVKHATSTQKRQQAFCLAFLVGRFWVLLSFFFFFFLEEGGGLYGPKGITASFSLFFQTHGHKLNMTFRLFKFSCYMILILFAGLLTAQLNYFKILLSF